MIVLTAFDARMLRAVVEKNKIYSLSQNMKIRIQHAIDVEILLNPEQSEKIPNVNLAIEGSVGIAYRAAYKKPVGPLESITENTCIASVQAPKEIRKIGC